MASDERPAFYCSMCVREIRMVEPPPVPEPTGPTIVRCRVCHGRVRWGRRSQVLRKLIKASRRDLPGLVGVLVTDILTYGLN